MRALDTNILVRFVTADNASQLQRAAALFREASEKRDRLYVSLPVLLELLWVLSQSYRASRDSLVATLDHLVNLPFLRFEQEDCVRDFLRQAVESPLDLADLLLGVRSKHAGCTTTLTFDRRTARSPLFTAL